MLELHDTTVVAIVRVGKQVIRKMELTLIGKAVYVKEFSR